MTFTSSTFTASHLVPARRLDVWQWHTRPGAAARLIPPFAPMQVLQQASSLRDGTTVFALPLRQRWVARHLPEGYHEGYQFIDVCENAPLAQITGWKHTHTLSAGGTSKQQDGAETEVTKVTDTVETRGFIGTIAKVVAYRQHQLIQDFAAKARFETLQREQGCEGERLVVGMTGASGLIGQALTAQLQTLGHEVISLTRSPKGDSDRQWDPQHPSEYLLEGIDVLVHLAGKSIMGRFTEEHRNEIRASRVQPTAELAKLASRSQRCRAIISASAIGMYGYDRGDEVLDEQASSGEGFLASVCREWEAAALSANNDTTTRAVCIRTGVVLSGSGGLLPLVQKLYSAGLGGELGGGVPWFSWIAIDDLCDIYVRAILDASLEGPVNAVAPNPVRQEGFTEALGRELHRPTVMPIPDLGPALLLGSQGAKELALANQRVRPAVLLDRDHVFRYPTIEAALAHELGREQLEQA